MKNKTITTLIAGGLIAGGAVASSLLFQPAQDFSAINWTRPTTDVQWAEDVKKESLNFKTDKQLQEMKVSHEAKLVNVMQPALEKTNYPDAYRWELMQGGMTEPELSAQVDEWIENTQKEYQSFVRSVERINKEIELRASKKVDRTDDIINTKPSTEEEKLEIERLKLEKNK